MTVKEAVYFKRTSNCVETTEVGGVIIPLIKMCDYQVYLYGGGRDIEVIMSFFDRNDVVIEGIVDEDKQKQGKEIKGIKYISPDEFRYVVKNPEKTFVIITTRYFVGTQQMKIVSVLTRAGIDKFYVLDNTDKNEMTGLYPGWVGYFRERIEDLERIEESLYDDESRTIFKEYIRCVVAADTFSLRSNDSRGKYFWGDVIDGSREEIYRHLDDEIWVNCGSNVGDSIFLFFQQGLRAKRIYAYEGHPTYYSYLESNIGLLPSEFRQYVTPVMEYITNGTNFDNIEDKITLLNADIEGNELNMLRAMEQRIVSDRPVVAICVYHKKEDIVEIPKYLSTILPNSRLYLRKYESLIQDIRRKDELVLYVVPEERAII